MDIYLSECYWVTHNTDLDLRYLGQFVTSEFFNFDNSKYMYPLAWMNFVIEFRR